jgi:uncharacterized protein YbaP (TraB family)
MQPMRDHTMIGRKRGVLGALAVFFVVVVVVLGDGATAGERAPYAVGRLWQVEKGTAAPSYVFGTFHIPDPRVERLPRRVEDLVATVDRLVLELHPDELGRASDLALLPPGETLERFVDGETLSALLEMGREAGLPPDAVLKLRPMMIASVVGIPPRMTRRLAAGHEGVDLQLAKAASDRGIPIYALESLEEQIAALSAVEDGHEAEILRQAVAFRSHREEIYERMLEAYLSGDILAFLDITLETFRGEDEALAEVFMDEILYRRNRLFVTRLSRHLADGNALIAIGAAHIPGRDGILDLLDADGYRITRLE